MRFQLIGAVERAVFAGWRVEAMGRRLSRRGTIPERSVAELMHPHDVLSGRNRNRFHS
jgi:hypothetical protein